ncbi:Uncharacterised protein [Mycobacteroides abscessus subsp. abscessus]|nr:Uncharacterised protein [Mycobacteroides abscessus subsp. abscessus]
MSSTLAVRMSIERARLHGFLLPSSRHPPGIRVPRSFGAITLAPGTPSANAEAR